MSATGCSEAIASTVTRPGQAVLPPPFVVPLYMARARGRDVSDDPAHDHLANTLSLATVVTLVLIAIVGVVYAS